MSLIVNENFNRADGVHMSYFGWVTHPTVTDYDLAVGNNAGRSYPRFGGSVGETVLAYYGTAPANANQDVTSAGYSSGFGGAEGGYAMVLLRFSSTTTDGYWVGWTAGVWKILKAAGGVLTELASGGSAAFSASGVFPFRATIDASNKISLYAGSDLTTTPVAQYTDVSSPITATGYVGVFIQRLNLGIDNFVAYDGFSPADTTPPTLTLPTGTASGSTTATGTVTTNEANGTLYFLASVNATETVATVKASVGTQVITTTGLKSVSFSGLTASTAYYAHYVHTDAAANDSTRVSSSSFATSAGGGGSTFNPQLGRLTQRMGTTSYSGS